MVKAIAVLEIWVLFGLYFGIGGIARIKLDETLIKDTVNVSYSGLVN